MEADPNYDLTLYCGFNGVGEETEEDVLEAKVVTE